MLRWMRQRRCECSAEIVRPGDGTLSGGIYAGDHNRSRGGDDAIAVGDEVEADGRTAEMDKANFNVDEVIVTERDFEIAFDVDARKGVGAVEGVADAVSAQEFNFSRFEVAEHGGVVDAAAGIGVDETDAGLMAEGLLRHQIRIADENGAVSGGLR